MENILSKMIENGRVINSQVYKNSEAHWLLDGIIYVAKASVKFLSTASTLLEPVFILVSIGGFFLVMAGFEKTGKKIVSGSILIYIICKVGGHYVS